MLQHKLRGWKQSGKVARTDLHLISSPNRGPFKCFCINLWKSTHVYGLHLCIVTSIRDSLHNSCGLLLS